MSTTENVTRHITSDPDVNGGKSHISGRRITVQQIAFWHERQGMAVDEIATTYELSLGDVYAALAYYHDHRQAFDEAIAADSALIARLRSQSPTKLGTPERG